MRKMIIAIPMALVTLLLVGGCGSWHQKYETCNAELKNLEALFNGAQQSLQQCQTERDDYSQKWQTALRALESSKTTERSPGALEREGGVYDAARGTITVTLSTNLLFDSGKVALKQDSKTRLSRITDIIRRDHANSDVWVIGHTDTDPIKKSKWKDNWQLSTERSLSVTRYLVEKGIRAEQLVAAGRGQYHPIGSNKSANRRVEIVVHTGS